MQRRRTLPALGLFAAMLAGAGCVLFVNDDPSTLHTTCTFQGQDTPCAKCVESSCSKQLADCCGDSVCVETALPVLSTCAPDSTLCGLTLAGAPELASCVTSACVASCGGGSVNVGSAGDAGDTTNQNDGSTSTFDAGSTNCSPSGDSCFCEVGHPNGAVCNPSTLKGPGLCCADYGWPNATGTDCTCEPFSCTPESNGGALCNLSPDSTLTTTWTGNCCAYSTFCDCESSGDSCGTATPVSQCDVTTIGCSSSQVQVTSCSF